MDGFTIHDQVPGYPNAFGCRCWPDSNRPEHRQTVSAGHVAFAGGYEYVQMIERTKPATAAPKWQLMRAAIGNVLGHNGYRAGLRWETDNHSQWPAVLSRMVRWDMRDGKHGEPYVTFSHAWDGEPETYIALRDAQRERTVQR